MQSLFGSRSFFGAILEGNIPFEIEYIRGMTTNVSIGLFALSS